jgi:hypothetical protein
MPLSFPNSARSYDGANRRVRFLGHDGMFEVRFYVSADVLAGELSQKIANAGDYLASFDALRSRILKVAEKVYAATGSRTITLDLEHFR